MKSVSLFFALALVIASCSNPSEPTPETPTMKVPGTGSTYVFDTYGTDESGAKISGSDAEFTESVIASNISFGGRTGVWSVIGSASTDTTHYCLDANKDVLLNSGDLEGVLGGMKWLRYPVTTGTTQKDTAISTQNINGISIELVAIVTSSRVGEEQITVGSEAVKVVKLTSEFSVTAKAFGQVVNESTLTSTLWYAPSLGLMVRRVIPAQNVGGDLQEGTVEMLKSYSLK